MNLPVALPEVAPLTTRDKVFIVEDEMRKHERVEVPIRHYFSQGVYAREMAVKKGTLLTGKIHKMQQINVLSKGDVSVLTDDGMLRVQAPFTMVAPAGSKRVFYAHEDSVWTVFLPTDEKDPDKIEKLFTAETEAEYTAFLESAKIKEIA